MQKRQESIVNASTGKPVGGATVTVTTLAGVAATLYTSNGAGLIVGNSVTTDDNGLYFYYAADGRYTETISGNGITVTVITDIILEDPSDGLIFPARTAGRGQNIIATHDLGPFLGDPDPVLRIGYNYTATGNPSQAGEPGAQFCIEGYYNDGSGAPKIEMYWQVDGLTGQGAEFRRPIFVIANRATSAIELQTGADTVTFGNRSLTVTIGQVLYTSLLTKEIVVGTLLPLNAAGYNGFRANGASGSFYDLLVADVREGSFYADGTGIFIQSSQSRSITFQTFGSAAKQVEISHTASASRYLTLTGSNGGNPTISTSAGNLAITPAVVVAATSGSAIGTTTSSTTVLNLPAGSTAASSMRLAHGAAPTSPVNGDMWTTTAGLFVRVNGATVGPLT